uniref:protein disulfide-isomerase n=2 Tax=Florenciella parvula TaxID=236787 RepID=A0A7S2B2F2_9STRA|mmetsp:Transcript_12327/g.25937  ORF Transcript_12327/g.25937 Transcript_12327/m.25937 type:complete len:1033 (+) Transcript_12327:154-3252(+)
MRALELLVLLAAAVASSAEPLIGTDDNWEEVLVAKPLVFVGFFAPWCGHCKALKPHWAEVGDAIAAKTAAEGEEELAIAEVDVVASPGVYWRYDIQSFPVLKLFRHGLPIGTCDGRSAKDILKWIEPRRKFVPSMAVVTAPTEPGINADISDMRSYHGQVVPVALRAAVVGVFDGTTGPGSPLDIFQSIALSHASFSKDDMVEGPPPPPFAIMDSSQTKLAAANLGVTAPGIAVVRTNADVANDSEVELVASPPGLLEVSKTRTIEEVAEEVRGWIDDQRYPVILEWTTENKPFIFTRRPGFETHVLLFIPPNMTPELETELLVALTTAGEKYRRQALFLFLRIGDGHEEGTQLARELNVGGADSVPAVMVVKSDAKEGDITFFRRPTPEGVDFAPALTGSADIETFIDDYFNGDVAPDASNPVAAAQAAGGAAGGAAQAEEEDEGPEVDESDVQVLLSEESFDQLLKQNEVGLVEAYAPWCGHCKKLKPGYAAAATELTKAISVEGIELKPVVLAKFDATHPKTRELGEKLSVDGFPSLFVFFKGVVFDFQGDRTPKGIVEAMRNYQLKHAALPLTSEGTLEVARTPEAVKGLMEAAQPPPPPAAPDGWDAEEDGEYDPGATEVGMLVLAVVSGAAEEVALKTMEQIALQYTPPDISDVGVPHVSFGAVSVEDEAALAPLVEAGVLPPGAPGHIRSVGGAALALSLVQHGASTWSPGVVSVPQLLTQGPWMGAAEGTQFLTDAFRPPLVEMGDNAAFNDLMGAQHVLQVVLFDNFARKKDALLPGGTLWKSLEAIVAKVPGRRACFVAVDSQHGGALDFFGLGEADLPAVRVVNISSTISYNVTLHPKAKKGALRDADAASLNACDEALGKAFDPTTGTNLLIPNKRSEPLDAANMDYPLKSIVGSMWEDVVLGEAAAKQDVVIVYFDPDCPHCKKMLPVIEKVANEAESARPNLTFLQLDITANDPDGWENPEGVPTVHLYPALADGSKSRGADEFVPYHGEPDVASLEGFLAKNAPLWGTGKAAGKSEL